MTEIRKTYKYLNLYGDNCDARKCSGRYLIGYIRV